MAEPILTFDTLIEPIGSQMAERYELISADDAKAQERLGDFRVALTNGGLGIEAAWIEKLPKLELIAVNGVGTDQIDLDLCAARRIHVATTLGVLTDDVADMALGLTLAVLRDLGRGQDFVRSGEWAEGKTLPLGRSLKGKRIGIVGLGAIGRAIGERAQAFKMDIGFWNRSEKSVAGWTTFSTPVALAEWADVLVVAVAATGETQGLIDTSVLEALGRDGFVVNIARGSVIDEVALLDALEARSIAGAGLDVFLNEPRIDPRFAKLDNVFLVPHVGSATIETRTAMAQLVKDNVDAYLAGQEPPTSITAKHF
ncbi:2-hydroxyacid dehydrogenase [Pelagibacterium luteolum]|uniref:Lactate dehydrogenase n=1 Tax=Pelagibacterium luteolum TaxID=440168 RepID=A0A1G7S551_9HYPH|nr:2-hydroxyacid dehydrogenase [Pelagibacterium luteolum]SDG18082.1 Lactate dehydrogenase [Pelagibacterium luteolum]